MLDFRNIYNITGFAMQVLFKNIPIRTTAGQLVNYIQSGFNNNEVNISADSVELMEIQDNFTHPNEKFGIVSFSSSDLARKVIQQFNGNDLNEYKITVREFFIRSTKNDPRIKLNDTFDEIREKRENDRRLFENRSINERRLIDRRIKNEFVANERRLNERRVKDRGEKHLVYSRRI